MDSRAFLSPYADIATQRRQALRVLGLAEGVGRSALQRRFRELARAHHPDLGGAPGAFRRVVNAYLVLTRADPRGYDLGDDSDESPTPALTQEEYWRWWISRFAP